MKKFKFDLEKILELRRIREEECKIALGRAISVLNKIENDIMQTAAKRHNAASMRFTDIVNILSWDTYILRLDREAEKLTEQAAQAELIVEEKRAEYIEASSGLEALEKLKKIRMEEYKKKMETARAAEIDELISARVAMNM